MTDLLDAKLKFLDYQVVRFNLDAPLSDKETVGHVALTVGYQIMRRADSDLDYLITLTVNANKQQKEFKAVGFRFSLELAGFFRFDQNVAQEERDRMIALNGLATLYGTARGAVSQLTAQSTLGKIVIPTMNIMELIKSHDAEEKRRASKKPRPASKAKSPKKPDPIPPTRRTSRKEL